MHNKTFIINGENFRQIQRTSAKKIFLEGGAVYALPCKIKNFDYLFKIAAPADHTGNGNDFEIIVNDFAFKTCNSSNGYYPSFFIKF